MFINEICAQKKLSKKIEKKWYVFLQISKAVASMTKRQIQYICKNFLKPETKNYNFVFEYILYFSSYIEKVIPHWTYLFYLILRNMIPSSLIFSNKKLIKHVNNFFTFNFFFWIFPTTKYHLNILNIIREKSLTRACSQMVIMVSSFIKAKKKVPTLYSTTPL